MFLFLVIFSLFFAFIMISLPIDNPNHAENSGFYIKTSAATILIDGDDELALNASTGDGSEENPYIIENYVIDANGLNAHGISINNTRKYFIIRNCTVNDADQFKAGIRLQNVTNSKIIDNKFSSGYFGINLDDYCSNNSFINNSASSNSYGIYVYNHSHNNQIINNDFNGNNFDIYLSSNVDSNYMLNNTIGTASPSGSKGIFVGSGFNNSIINNSIMNKRYYGIELNVANYTRVINNSVINTNANGYPGWGLYIRQNARNNLLLNNTLIESRGYGVYIDQNCYNNTLISNNVSENGLHGIFIESPESYVIDGVITGNTGYGIYINSTNNVSITNNFISNNLNGICINSSSLNNSILNNTIEQNTNGILILNSNRTNMIYNLILDNTENSIYLVGANDSVVYRNALDKRYQDINETTNSTDNVIEENFNPIIIAQNSDFDTFATQGDGSKATPYVIEDEWVNIYGLKVDAISIKNTDSYFTLINCSITHVDAGYYALELYDVVNANITNNTLKYCGNWAISMSKMENSSLSDNIIHNNSIGMYSWNSHNNTYINNSFSYSMNGLWLWSSTNNTFTNNTLNYNSNDGMYLMISSNNNTIHNNILTGNKNGIEISNHCDNNTVTNNWFFNNSQYGIVVSSSNYTQIKWNLFRGNTLCIYLTNANGTIEEGNDCDCCSDGGENPGPGTVPIPGFNWIFVILTIGALVIIFAKQRTDKNNTIKI